LRIPQTVIFRDGVLKAWYFSGAGGTIRRKGKKSLEKSILLREFIKEAKPGRPVALVICSRRGGDGMTTTCTSVLDESAFMLLVKNAFSTRMNCMLQEYVLGFQKHAQPWVIEAVPDPRAEGQGWLEASWSPTHLELTLRAECELVAISHEVVETVADDVKRMTRPRVIIHHRSRTDTDPLRSLSEEREQSEAKQPLTADTEWEYPVKAQGSSFKRYPRPESANRSGRASAPPALAAGGLAGAGEGSGDSGPGAHLAAAPVWRSAYARNCANFRQGRGLASTGGRDYYQHVIDP
jgi:hypothetical protein